MALTVSLRKDYTLHENEICFSFKIKGETAQKVIKALGFLPWATTEKRSDQLLFTVIGPKIENSPKKEIEELAASVSGLFEGDLGSSDLTERISKVLSTSSIAQIALVSKESEGDGEGREYTSPVSKGDLGKPPYAPFLKTRSLFR